MASVSLSKHFTVLTSILLICGLVVVLVTIQERKNVNEEQNSRHKKSVSPWKRDTDVPVGTACHKDTDQCLAGAECVEISAGAYQCRYSEGSTGCTSDQNCVPGATCGDGNTCTTASPVVTTPQSTQTTASPVVTTPQSTQRLNVGESCVGPDHDNCASGLTCDSTDTCKLTAGGNCASPNDVHCATGLICTSDRCRPFPLNRPCNNATDCPGVNLTCNTVLNKCECDGTHYADDANTCSLRKKVTEACNIDTPQKNECTEGAECVAHYCVCVTDRFYEKNDQTCEARKGENDPCTVSKECIPNAECNNVPTASPTAAPVKICQCEQDYYHDTTGFNKCLLKHAIGESCVNITQCVNGATGCSGSPNEVCQCSSTNHYTTVNGSCLPRLGLYGECHETIPYQCYANAVCSGGHCQCDDHSFVKGQLCTPTIAVGILCDYFNREERQCESDTKCVFRYWDNTPVCGCDIDHFFNGHVCQPRALAGDPCPYDPNYPHDSLRLKIEHQCVDNAVCNPTTLICECEPTHYYQRGQHCPPRIEQYGTCDPWANYYHQCVNGYACVHGRCV